MDDPNEMPCTVVLLSGYARSGKDTFARGLMRGAKTHTKRIAFADALKEAGDEFMCHLGLFNGSFLEEGFKNKHRDVLVSLGTFARSLDKDVFAQALCDSVLDADTYHVVVPDCRYLNEINVVKSHLGDLWGYRVVHIRIMTEGIGPANEEEERSFKEMNENSPADYVIEFWPEQGSLIEQSGERYAKLLNL